MRNFAAIVTGLLLISLAGNWYFWDLNRDSQNQRFSDNTKAQQVIEAKTAEISSRDTAILTLGKKLHSDSLKFLTRQIASNEQITGYKKTIARLRPIVQAKIDSFPDLRDFVASQDSTIAQQDSLIAVQEIFCVAQIRSLQDIIALEVQKQDAQKEITAAVTEQLAISTKETRKERRGKRFWQVVGGILAAGIIYQSVR